MGDLILKNFKGSTITVAITGLPILITGKVLDSDICDIVTIKANDGKIINIAEKLIAFFF